MNPEQSAILLSLVQDRIAALQGIALEEGLLRQQLESLLDIEQILLKEHLATIRRITFGNE